MEAMFKNSAAGGLMAQGAAYGDDQFGCRRQEFVEDEDRHAMDGEEFGDDGGNESGEPANGEQEFGGGEVGVEEDDDGEDDGEEEEEDVEEDVEEEVYAPAATAAAAAAAAAATGLKRKSRAAATPAWQAMEQTAKKMRRRGNGGESCSSRNSLLALMAFVGEAVVRIERSKLEAQKQLLLMRAQSEKRRIEMEAKSHEMFVNMQLQLAELIAQRNV